MNSISELFYSKFTMALRSWLKRKRRGSASTSNESFNSSLTANTAIDASSPGGNSVVGDETLEGEERQPLLSAEAAEADYPPCDEPLPIYEVLDPLPITSYEEVA